MSVLYVLVPLTIVLVTAAVSAFIWAARRGQLDDLETPALRMLHEDESPEAVPAVQVRSFPPPSSLA